MKSADDFQALLARHVDLKPLRDRRRGKVRCCFHRERTASMSVDLDKAAWHCFGCGLGGGVRRFAELVGEIAPVPVQHRAAQSPLAEARRRALQEAWQQQWNRPGVRDLYAASDWLRVTRRKVDALRGLVGSLGAAAEELEIAHEALARAAHLESLMLAVSHQLDDALIGGRL